jgi:crotonobetainyl-CoA:carnitine CoA-transferase CaiB-like acyl-CoA transferase
MGYVLAVRANHTVITGSGRIVTAAAAAGLIPARAWHRMRTGSGTKGTRHYDWAMLQVADSHSAAADERSIVPWRAVTCWNYCKPRRRTTSASAAYGPLRPTGCDPARPGQLAE